MPENDTFEPAGGGWLREVKERRTEAIAATVRSFTQSRQSITEGRLSEDERLIRFCEGVAMSLESEPTEEQFEETESCFRAVFRHDSSLNVSLNPEDRLLRLQARYNLAVVQHRQYLRLDAAPPSRRTARPTLQPLRRQVGELAKLSKENYSAVIVRLREDLKPGTNPSGNTESLRERRVALFLAASVGLLNLLLQSERKEK